MANETYMIPEGGVCGAFNTDVQTKTARTHRKIAAKKIEADVETIDWSKVPDDFVMRLAEVVEDINDKSYVPTKVLYDLLEKDKQRHHGDEPTTEQESNIKLVEKELENRGLDTGYGD